MGEILIFGGALAAVLVFRWGARRLYYGRDYSFELDGRIYTHHADGSFSSESARIIEPLKLAALQAEWAIVSDAHSSTRRGRIGWRGGPAARGKLNWFERGVEKIGGVLDRFRF